MSFSEKSLLVPRRGLIMRADPHTAPPDIYDPGFDPTNPGGGWTTLGHHSRENLAKLTKDGGEKTVLSSWWTESLVEIVTESIKWGFEFSQVQVDKATLELAFPGLSGGVQSFTLRRGEDAVAEDRCELDGVPFAQRR